MRRDAEKDHDVVVLRNEIRLSTQTIREATKEATMVFIGMLFVFWITLLSKGRIPNLISEVGYLSSLAALTYLGSRLQRLWEVVDIRRARTKYLRELLEDRYGIVEH